MAPPAKAAPDGQAVALVAPRSVELGGIERELDRLWKEAGGAGDSAVLRACALNLVVWSKGGESVDQLAQEVGPITAQNPCRTILLSVDPDSAAPLSASISAYCQLPARDRRQVCCEQILIASGRDGIDDLSALVLGLLIPDLPSFLWWRGEPPGAADPFGALAEACDRLLFDSAQFAAPKAGLIQLAELARAEGAPRLGDLHWARLEPWRQLIAQAFDRPERLDSLRQLERVEIACAEPPSAGALLLGGWLASRLGKRLRLGEQAAQRSEDLILRLRREKGGQATPSGLLEVRLTCRAQSSLLLQRHGGSAARIRFSTGAKETAERPVALEEPDQERVVGSELERIERDPVYEAALQAAAEALQPR